MQVDEKLLSKLEKLSALRIADKERTALVGQLSEIVNFVEKLNELDLDSTEVVINTIKGGTPFRADKVENKDIIQDVLKHAPKQEGNFFIVPKIIE